MRLLPVLLLLFVLCGCTSRVQPPSDLTQPETIFLVENGSHGSLVFQSNRATLVQFDFGEWRWYALNHTATLRVFSALFWPSTGTLARREVPHGGILHPERVRALLAGERAWAFQVEKPLVDELFTELEFRYQQARRISEEYDPALDTWFVPDETDYHLFYNCNHAAIEWLERLGCTVTGPYFTWDWDVDAVEPAVSPLFQSEGGGTNAPQLDAVDADALR